MPLPLLAMPLMMAFSGVAQAGLPVELPPGEEPELWAPALLMAQQLLPELELGPALGPGPSVRVVAAEEAWLLDVAGAQGRRVPVRMPVPQTDEARMELLLVCADLLARDEIPAEESPAPAPEITGGGPSWAWVPPRVAAAFWLPLAAGPQVAGVLEPGGLAWHDLSASARMTLASPMHFSEDLSLRGTHLTVALRGSWRDQPVLDGSLEGGVCLRRVFRDGEEVLRDWTPAVGAGLGLGWPVTGGWEVTVTGGALADLPPAVLVSSHGEVRVPSWTLQLTIGLQFPAPGQGVAELDPSATASPRTPIFFSRSKHRSGVTSG